MDELIPPDLPNIISGDLQLPVPPQEMCESIFLLDFGVKKGRFLAGESSGFRRLPSAKWKVGNLIIPGTKHKIFLF